MMRSYSPAYPASPVCEVPALCPSLSARGPTDQAERFKDMMDPATVHDATVSYGRIDSLSMHNINLVVLVPLPTVMHGIWD